MLINFEGKVIETCGFHRWLEAGMACDNMGISDLQVQFILGEVQTQTCRVPIPWKYVWFCFSNSEIDNLDRDLQS
jgi:hypothetical protein